MHVIRARNVNHALRSGLEHLLDKGLRTDSRNGAVIRAPEPVCTVYERPWERILWLSLRDCNPIFHFLEAAWMLAGRNDVGFPSRYAKQLAEYSDDGKTLNAAYGHRWRVHFGYDQLRVIINELKSNPDSRRCVLQMWDGGDGEGFETSELYKATHGCKDTACNTATYFEVLDGKLNMTVTNRSNDVIWGAYGANAVHFSILQEYMASSIGVAMGRYEQISNNYHVYIGRPDVDRLFDGKGVYVPDPRDTDLYLKERMTSISLFDDPAQFDIELADFFKAYDAGFFEEDANCVKALSDGSYLEPSIALLAIPMVFAHRAFKAGDIPKALAVIYEYMHMPDWKAACLQWFDRRQAAKDQKSRDAEAKAVGQAEVE